MYTESDSQNNNWHIANSCRELYTQGLNIIKFNIVPRF